MEWETIKDNKRIYYILNVEETTTSAVRSAMRKLWLKLFRDVMPRHPEETWDTIKVEFWSDSGGIVAYPSEGESVARDEWGGCKLVLQSLLDAWIECEDLYLDEDDKLFDQKIQEMQLQYAKELLNKFEACKNDTCIQQHLQKRPLLVACYDADSHDSFFRRWLE